MISDFDLLTQKVGDLAAMTHALRRENAELRAHTATLIAENSELAQRVQGAHERVTALLARIPDPHAEAVPDAVQQEPA